MLTIAQLSFLSILSKGELNLDMSSISSSFSSRLSIDQINLISTSDNLVKMEKIYQQYEILELLTKRMNKSSTYPEEPKINSICGQHTQT